MLQVMNCYIPYGICTADIHRIVELKPRDGEKIFQPFYTNFLNTFFLLYFIFFQVLQSEIITTSYRTTMTRRHRAA